MRAQRAALLQQLDSLQQLIPGDAWLLGQRVRFRVDQGEHEAIADLLADCPLAFWCAALRGYALAQRGELRVADSVFSIATAVLVPAARCSWTDIAVLLPGPGVPNSPRTEYEAADCATRDSLARQYWWLADPLFFVAGNERRATHFARAVLVLLKSGLSRDERYYWSAAHGSDAPREMLLRYGWPTASVRMGEMQDRFHNGLLLRNSTPVSSPYTTAEYSSGRVAFGPNSDALRAPFAAPATSWTLRPPPGQVDQITVARAAWWPIEHMRHTGDVQALDDAQIALLRREGSVQLAVATSVLTSATPLAVRLRTDSAPALLLVSRAPDSIDVVGTGRIDAPTGQLVVQGLIAARPAVVGVEAAHPVRPNDAIRLRFGITPPPTLDALPAGAIAVSDPVLFAPSTQVLPADAPAMFPRMLPSTTVTRGGKLGVFWETYGVPAGDSVRFTITVSRLDRSNALERLTEALRLRDAPVGSLAVSWQDPDRAPVPATVRQVPIMPRSLVLDLQPLTSGTYRVTVEVTAPGRGAVRGQRDITVE